MTWNRVLTLSAAMWLCAVGLQAAQRTFVSAANGNDTNPCSRTFPCRNFAAAVTLADPNGEVIVLDSGGYGTVSLTKAVSLISPSGVYAGITSFLESGVTVTAGDTAHVTLRNLVLNSQGATTPGINVTSVAALYVDGCVVSGFSEGISFGPASPQGRLHVTDSEMRENDTGIYVAAGAATIDSVRLYGNGNGVWITASPKAMIRHTVASGGISGVWAHGGRVMLEDSVVSYNVTGVLASLGALITVSRSAVTHNASVGIKAEDEGTPSKVLVHQCTIAGNAQSVLALNASSISAFRNNTMQGNATRTEFTGYLVLK